MSREEKINKILEHWGGDLPFLSDEKLDEELEIIELVKTVFDNDLPDLPF